MAEVVAPRGKRARSPSPAYGGDTLASPLEVLLKRRRRGERGAAVAGNNGASGVNSGVGGSSTSGGMFVPPPPPVWRPDPYAGGRGGHQHNSGYNPGGGSRDEGEMDHDASSSVAAMSSPLRHRRDDDDDMAESSTAWMRRAGIERRRQRAWEYLQNPTASAPSTAIGGASTSNATGTTLATHQTHPYSLSQPQVRIDSSPAAPSRYSRARSASLPPPAAAQTPEPVAGAVSSSPVRHEPPSSTPFRGGSGDINLWTEDERMREWGEEYSAQNSILYSLHRARVESASDPPTPVSDLYTPHQQAFTTQTHTTPNSHPYGHLPTPYRYAQRTPLETPGLVSSPYESSPIPFSPATAPPAGPMPSPADGNGHGLFEHEHAAVRAGYEEANRLLASLNVARLRRQRDEEGAGIGGAVAEGENGTAGGDGGQHARTRMDVMDEHW